MNNQEQVINENQSRKKTNKVPMILLMVLSILLIGIGVYLSYISNPKKIIATSTKNLMDGLEKILIETPEDQQIGNNYTLNSNIKFNVSSDYLTMVSSTDPTYQAYCNILKNLNQTENSLTISQDQKNKKLLVNMTSTLNQQDLLSGKYLIEDATQYYYIKNFLDMYINNGNSNYFEALEESTTTKENMIYIYELVTKLFQENLKDEYFTKYQETTTVNNKEQKLTKVSLKITDKRIKKLAKNILKDLKKDEKASKILTGIDKDFSKSKIDEERQILNENQSIEWNVYTDSFLYKIKKYELKFLDDTKESKMTYEKIDKNGKLYITEDDRLIARLDITNEDNKSTINVFSSTDKDLGTITLEKTDTESSINLNVNNDKTIVELQYDSKISDVKKNTSYTNNTNISLKVVSNDVSLVNATVSIISNISNEAKIEEDVSNSVLASTITEEQYQSFQQQMSNILLELMK